MASDFRRTVTIFDTTLKSAVSFNTRGRRVAPYPLEACCYQTFRIEGRMISAGMVSS